MPHQPDLRETTVELIERLLRVAEEMRVTAAATRRIIDSSYVLRAKIDALLALSRSAPSPSE